MAEAKPPAPPTFDVEVDAYRPLNARRRLVLVALAVGTSVGGVLTLLSPPGGVVRKRPPAPEVPVCGASAAEGASGCVGGMATVLPVAPPASGR